MSGAAHLGGHMYKYIAYNDNGITKIWSKATHIVKIEKQENGTWVVIEIIYQFECGERKRVNLLEEMNNAEEAKEAMKILYKALGQEQNQSSKQINQRLYLDKNNLLVIPLDDLQECISTPIQATRLSKIAQLELRVDLENAIDQLPKKQQDVILQRYFAELSVNEIAESEGVDKSAISHREKRALKNLKNILAGHQLSA